eukprot:PhF_6_TR3486/c0_g1_i3/m.5120/K07025/K07025; putative hydrolase of the HAD superfamily
MSAAVITAVLFDFGGVIFTTYDPDALNPLALELGFPNGKALRDRVYHTGHEWKLGKVGQLTHTQMWQSILKDHPTQYSDEQLSEIAMKFRTIGREVAGEMKALLAALKARNVKIGVLSNYDDSLEKMLSPDNLNLESHLDVICNSATIQAAKPDLTAFHIALQRMGIPPQQILFVDDKKSNTDAAESLGMASHVYNDFGDMLKVIEEAFPGISKEIAGSK